MEIINIIKFWSLSMHLFNILCDEVGSMYTALSLYTKYDDCVEEKYVAVVWVATWTTAFFMEHSYLKEWLTDKLII